jgi:hypothetical protein
MVLDGLVSVMTASSQWVVIDPDLRGTGALACVTRF